jgi:hypothetical protein
MVFQPETCAGFAPSLLFPENPLTLESHSAGSQHMRPWFQQYAYTLCNLAVMLCLVVLSLPRTLDY